MTTILLFILLTSLNDNPPGTIKINNHFVDRTEIQNIHWLEYLYYKRQEMDSVELQKLLPDSSNLWYTHPDNRHKPIVLITYEQALEFCAWRSEVVSDRIGKKVTYRLPTTIEWQAIAQELIETDLKRIERELQQMRKIVKKDSTINTLVATEKPKSRIYNMFDNVTEMTFEKGIAMGSNNFNLADPTTNITRLIKSDSPSTYLGFRCVAEIE